MPKTCTSCKESYQNPAEAFYARPEARDGLNTKCKECVGARRKAYYTKNRDKILTRSKEYAVAHREQRRANMKAWHERNKHRPRLDRQNAEYREYAKAKSKDWYRANRERALAAVKDWTRRHPEHEKNRKRPPGYTKARKARVRAAEGTLTAADIRRQFASQEGLCYWCDGEVTIGSFHVDHVVPLSKCGRNAPDNIVIACGPCNLRKTCKHPADFDAVRWARFQGERSA